MTDIVEQLRHRAEWDIIAFSSFDPQMCIDAADEIERLRATVTMWQAQVERVKESFSESVFIPYMLSKAIAKRDITFENLTAEQWFEIYKWFYKNTYDEYPDEPQA